MGIYDIQAFIPPGINLLMPLKESLDGFSWTLVEKTRLDGVFEQYRIPALVLPLAIIILLVAVLLLISQPSGPPGAPQAEIFCGDGACEPARDEDLISCPEDCAKKEGDLKTVKVLIFGQVDASIDVRIEDAEGVRLAASSGKKSSFTFSGLSGDSARAVVSNPKNSKAAQSDLISLEGKETEITVAMPSGFFEQTAIPKGVVRVTLKDAESGFSVTGKVTLVIPSGSSHTIVSTKSVPGSDFFTVDAGKWYAIIVDAEGYAQYDSRKSPINVEQGAQREIIAQMDPLVPAPVQASLRACAYSAGSALEGSVGVSSLSGDSLGTAPLISGCAQFSLLSGARVEVSFDSPGCSSAAKEVALAPGSNAVSLNLTCGPQVGQVRVKVTANETDVTRQATVTAFSSDGRKISGSGFGGSLLAAPTGYTEYVAADSSKKVYFTVTGVAGYSAFTSSKYGVNPGANKTVTLDLPIPEPPVYNFSFSGIAYPSPVVALDTFKVTVSRVLYGQTDVTSLANVTVEFAAQPCAVSKGSVWTAECQAPDLAGDYDLAVNALYSGRAGSKTQQVKVFAVGASSYFELVPHAILDVQPPIDIEMDITFNGTPLAAPDASSVGIYYVPGKIWALDKPALKGADGLYTIAANTPFPGDHRAEIYLMKTVGDAVYEQNFTITFDSQPSQVAVSTEVSASPRILEPEESFTAYLRITQGGKAIEGLANLKVGLAETTKSMPWDSAQKAYAVSLKAPEYESIYKLEFYIEQERIAYTEIFVVDTGKSRADDCDIKKCVDRPMVRECVAEYDSKKSYSESDVVTCIRTGLMIRSQDVTHCLSASARRGDWDTDCMLTSSDLGLMNDFFTKIPSQEERNEYRYCGDMDNDGDADEDDYDCITNILSTKWFGDYGDEDCASSMRGGFCFNISVGEPGDLDGSGNMDAADLGIMGDVVRIAGYGVTPDEFLLNITDFDMSGNVDIKDYDCLDSIVNGKNIAISCLAIYDFGCATKPGPGPDYPNGTYAPGDLTRDWEIDDTDFMIEGWIVNHRVDSTTVFKCADMNNDAVVDDEDYFCMDGTINGDITLTSPFCGICARDLQALGRYGQEICHDGLDNDCNGYTDENCTCDDGQSCSKLYDIDGLPETNDFAVCTAFGERDFSQWAAGATEDEEEDEDDEPEGGFDWNPIDDVDGMCSEEGWGNIMYCGGGEWTCLFNFLPGFSHNSGNTEDWIENNEGGGEEGGGTTSASEINDMKGFRWMSAEGNIGPLGATYDCHDAPDCHTGWNSVGTSSGSNCKLIYEKKCRYCRFEFDVCQKEECGPSGGGMGGCDDGEGGESEVCPAEGLCMGSLGGLESGEGTFDNRYELYLLWKPESASTHLLAVYIPEGYDAKGISRVYLAKDPDGLYVIEEGDDRGGSIQNTHSYGFSMKGGHYGTCYLIVEFSGADQSQRPLIHMDYGTRYEDDYRVVWHILTGRTRYSDHASG